MTDPAAWLGMVTSGWSEIGQTAFWVSLLQIMWINILLSGDNAVVIAMACRGLRPRQRLWGMILGAGVAVLLRIVFTVFVAALMLLPWLKIVGGLALFYIAAKLLVPEEADENETEHEARERDRCAHRQWMMGLAVANARLSDRGDRSLGRA